MYRYHERRTIGSVRNDSEAEHIFKVTRGENEIGPHHRCYDSWESP